MDRDGRSHILSLKTATANDTFNLLTLEKVKYDSVNY